MPAIGTLATPSDVETLAVHLARRPHLRQHARAARRAAAAARRPTASVWMLNSSVREALLTSVTCTRAAGELPDQPGVDGAERELARPRRARARRARCRASSGSWCREIGVDHEPGLRAGSASPAPSRLQPLAEVGGAAVLPDDRVVDRLAGRAVPDDRRLALVGDADRGDVARRAPARGPSASTATPICDAQISCGSCSTQPGCGKICVNSFCATARIAPSWSKTMARELVVPWSSARMYGIGFRDEFTIRHMWWSSRA